MPLTIAQIEAAAPLIAKLKDLRRIKAFIMVDLTQVEVFMNVRVGADEGQIRVPVGDPLQVNASTNFKQTLNNAIQAVEAQLTAMGVDVT